MRVLAAVMPGGVTGVESPSPARARTTAPLRTSRSWLAFPGSSRSPGHLRLPANCPPEPGQLGCSSDVQTVPGRATREIKCLVQRLRSAAAGCVPPRLAPRSELVRASQGGTADRERRLEAVDQVHHNRGPVEDAGFAASPQHEGDCRLLIFGQVSARAPPQTDLGAHRLQSADTMRAAVHHGLIGRAEAVVATLRGSGLQQS